MLPPLTSRSSLPDDHHDWYPFPPSATIGKPLNCVRGNSRCSRLDYSAADGVADQTGGGVDPQLEHDSAAVGLGGLHRDPQGLGDVLGGVALGDELQDLPLPVGE